MLFYANVKTNSNLRYPSVDFFYLNPVQKLNRCGNNLIVMRQNNIMHLLLIWNDIIIGV